MPDQDLARAQATQEQSEEDRKLRERAVRQLRKKRDFWIHVLVYMVINGTLVAIWAVADPHAFFWPVFPIVGWGIGVLLNAYDVYGRREIGEERIVREMRRLNRRG